jgi:hypothetical protein
MKRHQLDETNSWALRIPETQKSAQLSVERVSTPFRHRPVQSARWFEGVREPTLAGLYGYPGRRGAWVGWGLFTLKTSRT